MHKYSTMQSWILLWSIFSVVSLCSGAAEMLHHLQNDVRRSDTEPPYVTKFGCNFYAPGAIRLDTLLPPGQEPAAPRIVWGHDLKPLAFESEKELELFIRKIDEINQQVLEKYLYNSVDKYIRFYWAYKNSGLDFPEFFSRYQYHFIPRETCVSLSIEVLDLAHYKLKSRWPCLANHTFMAAVRTNILSEWHAWVENNWRSWRKFMPNENHKDSEHIVMDTGIRHSLAVIKIKVQERLGYILIDQGYSWAHPAVVMEDGKSPHTGRVQEGKQWNHFSFSVDNRYILWKLYNIQEHLVENRLIYLRPFCSFLEFTEKNGLLKPMRVITRSNNKGETLAGFYVTIKKNPEEGSQELTLLLSEGNVTEKSPTPIHYLSRRMMTTYDTEFLMERLGDIAKKLGFSRDVLLKKLQILEIILSDKQFVEACLKEYDHLNELDTAHDGDDE